MTERAINMKAKKYMELKAEIAALKEELEKIEEQIQAEMKNEKEMSTNQYIFLWPVINKTQFDTKAFKEKHPDLYQIFSKESSYRKFSVKEA